MINYILYNVVFKSYNDVYFMKFLNNFHSLFKGHIKKSKMTEY